MPCCRLPDASPRGHAGQCLPAHVEMLGVSAREKAPFQRDTPRTVEDFELSIGLSASRLSGVLDGYESDKAIGCFRYFHDISPHL